MASIIFGGITHHYILPTGNYCNRINNYGTIKNEYYIVMFGDNSSRIGFIKGKDSACGDIFGPVSTINMYKNIDIIFGAYNTNYKKFKDLGLEPPSVAGVTPILGLDFKIPLYETMDFSVKLENVISIGIITHAVSFNF